MWSKKQFVIKRNLLHKHSRKRHIYAKDSKGEEEAKQEGDLYDYVLNFNTS